MRLLVEPPRTTREYETVFVLKPDILDDERVKVLDRIQGIFDRLSGHILLRDEWGKRRLAYRIQKNTHGIYFYYRYLAYNDLVPEFERNMRILEPVLKYLTIKLEDDVDRDARIAQAKSDDESSEEDSEASAEGEATEEAPAATTEATSAKATEAASEKAAEATPPKKEEAE